MFAPINESKRAPRTIIYFANFHKGTALFFPNGNEASDLKH
jgi:hypothetical protein